MLLIIKRSNAMAEKIKEVNQQLKDVDQMFDM